MVGGGFQHNDSTDPFGTPEAFSWDKSSHLSKISVHVDDAVLWSTNKQKINFGWLLESSSIIPKTINVVLNNLPYFKSEYKNIFAHDRRIINVDPDFFKFVPPPAKSWIQNKKIYPKTKLVSMIASNKKMCKGHLFRQKVISRFQGEVDHFGRGFGSKELPWQIQMDYGVESGKLLALKDYMFSIAMENDNYDDIFVEKITDCFACGTIPIFWGTKNIGNYFDQEGIVMLEDLENLDSINPELYYSKMEYVRKNFNTVCNMQLTDDCMFENYLRCHFDNS
tara:strand:- start:107 stop:946 length:840 start_codon:yes stop_codon:yes gene_type:complete